MDIGKAIQLMREGHKVCRSGWNGKGIFIEMQHPDDQSKMSSPYIYIDTTGLQSSNEDAPRSLVPWLASQTDLLAEDWGLYADTITGEQVEEVRKRLMCAEGDDAKLLAMNVAEAMGITLDAD